MSLWQAILLGIVEGITEFLPVSSTGHLTVTEKLLGLQVDDPAVTAYTAVIQVGAIAAVFVYFWSDIARMAGAWFRGLVSAPAREDFHYRFAWYVIAGSIPIGIVGFAAQDLITGPLRNLWWVAGSLIVWSAAMVFGERAATQSRSEKQLNLTDTLVIGVVQCLALVPGVSRSGATITAGLLRDLDRVTATRLAFFLGVPALTAAGLYELKDAVGDNNVGVLALAVGTLVSFLVAYASIAWLLRFVAHHTMLSFVAYRVALGLAIVAMLGTGLVSAT
jgi:undecaprenyl-diphosphatase